MDGDCLDIYNVCENSVDVSSSLTKVVKLEIISTNLLKANLKLDESGFKSVKVKEALNINQFDFCPKVTNFKYCLFDTILK